MTTKAASKPETKNNPAAHAMRQFVDWLDEGSGVEPFFKYSGRAMYGEKCFGITGQLADIQTALMDFVAVHPDCARAVRDMVKTQRIDNMALDMIVYFPGVDIEPSGRWTDRD